ncbi:MAG: YggS family pyridoxal phosphate-dependent enzyme [Gammaproteobacteria bacterium]|nr:MAG: YggS family pyridoxal phosphate-dependent enzyme [Gammaproteobacteria bacterium]RLA24574.1 MAG: YggS family pyridoxal phosphate-dependent enzyme [Gammaproteobacteria bacterium]
MNAVVNQLAEVRKKIADATLSAGRESGSVRLLAVSKTKTAAELLCVYREGQRDFGENYLQEALDKQKQLSDCEIMWHFIGPIQSNKTRAIAEHFDWVHSVDRLKIARRLSEQRPEERGPLNICLQVNISNEVSKSGLSLQDLPDLVKAVSELPNLRLRGLMAIPAKLFANRDEQRIPFARLRETLEKMKEQGYSVDTLSMGMTEDLEIAISEGATWVRVGRAIFGERN